jgi:hypothetical protein
MERSLANQFTKESKQRRSFCLGSFVPSLFNLFAVVGLWLAGVALASAQGQNPRDAIESLRSDLKADRKVVIAEGMNLTPEESEAFWPLYRNYRAEVEKRTDKIVELVLEYADLYPNVPEARAAEMLKAYSKAEADLLSIKKKYFKQMGKVLPATKVFRFAQLDNRYDLGTRVALAGSVPLMPTAEAKAGNGTP